VDPLERDAKLDLVRDLLVGSLGDVASTFTTLLSLLAIRHTTKALRASSLVSLCSDV